MLDLNILREKSFDIKMLDGRELKIKTLSKAQMFAMDDLDKEIGECKDTRKQFNLICKRIHFILNNNLDGVKIAMKEVEDLDLNMMSAISLEYSKFIQGIANDPN